MSFKRSGTAVAISLVFVASALAQVRGPAVAARIAEPREAPPAVRYRFAAAPRSNLGPIDEAVRDKPPARRGLVRVAIERPVSARQMAAGAWQQTSHGTTVWRVALQSPNAVGVRLRFENFAVGNGRVWVHDAGSNPRQIFGPYTGRGRNGTGNFWTEVVFSDSVEVEYQPAAGESATDSLPFQITGLAHVWQFGRVVSPRTGQGSPTGTLQTISEAALGTPKNYQCLLDAACYTDPDSGTYDGTIAAAVRSSAIIIFTDPTGTYQCTGTLLNAPNTSPLFLTAGHCINSQEAAESMVAFFNAVNATCQQPPFTSATSAELSALPQATGTQLLSYADRAFIQEGDDYEDHNDLDYSLVLLNGFPENALLSGYNARPVRLRQQLVSVSAPQGMFFKAAFSIVIPNLWDNGFDVDQTMQGRIDAGSSGSGIFDLNGALVGLLSTGSAPCEDENQCPDSTSCDVKGEFIATYTSLEAIYPLISTYLNQPLNGPAATLPENPSVFSISPIVNMNPLGYGEATITMNVPAGITQIEIHVNAPDGPLFYRGPGLGMLQVPNWVRDGMVFYLQNISSGQPLTIENAIATATAHADTVAFTANPPVILSPNALGYGVFTLSWNVPGAQTAEVHVFSPDGPLFARSLGPTGWSQTGPWVTDGMLFVLCDTTHSACSTANTVATLVARVGSEPQSQMPTAAAPAVNAVSAWFTKQ